MQGVCQFRYRSGKARFGGGQSALAGAGLLCVAG